MNEDKVIEVEATEVPRKIKEVISENSTCKLCYGRGFIKKFEIANAGAAQQTPCPNLVAKFKKQVTKKNLDNHDCDFEMHPDKYNINNLSVFIYEKEEGVEEVVDEK